VFDGVFEFCQVCLSPSACCAICWMPHVHCQRCSDTSRTPLKLSAAGCARSTRAVRWVALSNSTTRAPISWSTGWAGCIMPRRCVCCVHTPTPTLPFTCARACCQRAVGELANGETATERETKTQRGSKPHSDKAALTCGARCAVCCVLCVCVAAGGAHSRRRRASAT
jgi:hypothetical protein